MKKSLKLCLIGAIACLSLSATAMESTIKHEELVAAEAKEPATLANPIAEQDLYVGNCWYEPDWGWYICQDPEEKPEEPA